MSIVKHKGHISGLFKIGLPITLGQVGIVAVGFIDNIMVGHHSTIELAAASFVNNFVNLAFVLGLGFSYGLTPLVSSSYAVKDGRLYSLLRSSQMANGGVGVLLTAVMIVFGANLHWFDQPAELLPYIAPYYAIQVASIVVTMLFYSYKQYADGVDQTDISMWVMLTSNVVNVVFNWLLIFGHWGFPEMGLMGAGIATFVARVYCLVVLAWVCERGAKFRPLWRNHWTPRGWEWAREVWRLVKLSVPISLQLGVEMASFSLAVIMVGWIGTSELAAHQIISVISTLGFMIFYGVAGAVTIRVSRYYDSRDVVNIRAMVRSGQLLLICLASLYVIFLWAARHSLGALFTDDPELISLVAVLCLPVMLYQYGDILQILYANTLRGMRDVVYMAICAVVCHIFLALSLVYLFAFVAGWGVVGVWMAFPVSLTSLGLLLYWRYRRLLQRMQQS